MHRRIKVGAAFTSFRVLAWISVVLLHAPFASAQTDLEATDWPEFRGRDHAGVADGAGLPTRVDLETGEGVAWTAAIPGLGHSSPIVVGETVYVTTAVPLAGDDPSVLTGDVETAGFGTVDDGLSYSWRLYAIDKRSGEIRWHRVAHEGVPRVTRHPKASHASATPASDGRYVVALLGSEGLFCFDLQGDLLWQRDLGVLDPGFWGEPDLQWAPASSPVIFEDLVIVQNDRQENSLLVALDLQTGDEVWRVARDEKPAWSTPTILRGERTELVLNGANWLTAYDPATGEEIWRFSNEDRQVITPTPIGTDDKVIITGGVPNGQNPIHAIRRGGEGDLTSTDEESGYLAWKVERGSPYTPTPIAYRGVLYVVLDNGILSAYDLETGERHYRERLPAAAGYSASPVASDGNLYFLSEDGDLVVVRAGTTFEVVATSSLGEVLMASPAISGDLLVVRGASHLFGLRGGD